EKYRAFAARESRYKLVQANGVAPNAKWTPKYELFDIVADPFEQKDIAADKPDEVARLKREYETWFADVTKLGFDPPRIVVGNAKENPVRLSRQDWRGPKAGWNADSEGHWDIHVERAGKYKLTIRSNAAFESYRCSIGDANTAGAAFGGKTFEKVTTADVPLKKGDTRVSGTVTVGKTTRGFDYVELEFVKP
ncbi:MAG TPA: hypothetical protein VMZ71_05915, partial [Gemmataceae bacterium]|nr:hypothetical protein [Gemmataceae bacterium]